MYQNVQVIGLKIQFERETLCTKLLSNKNFVKILSQVVDNIDFDLHKAKIVFYPSRVSVFPQFSKPRISRAACISNISLTGMDCQTACLPPPMKKSYDRAGVNFINILRTPISYKSLFWQLFSSYM